MRYSQDEPGYLYKLTNIINNMWYIGSRAFESANNEYKLNLSINSSMKDCLLDRYLGSGVDIKPAIKEFGIDAFIKDIISVVDFCRLEEEFLLTFLDAENDILSYNRTNLAGGGCKHTKEAKAKIKIYVNDSCYVNDGIINKRIYKSELQYYLDNGWFDKLVKGVQKRSQSTKDKISTYRTGKPRDEETQKLLRNMNKGKAWMNNGLDEKFIKPNDINDYLLQGWMFGKLKTHIWVNNGTNEKIKKDLLEEYLNNGYTRGKVKKLKI